MNGEASTKKAVLQEVEYAFNRYLLPQEAMDYLKISRQTLWRWVNELGLRQTKVGGVTLYDRKDIDDFLEKHKE